MFCTVFQTRVCSCECSQTGSVKVYVCGKNSGLARERLFIENPFQSLLSPFYLLQIPVKIMAVIPPNEGGRLAYSPAGARRAEEQCKGETYVPSALFLLRGKGAGEDTSNGSFQHAHGGEVREGPERPCDLPKATQRTTGKTRARAHFLLIPCLL